MGSLFGCRVQSDNVAFEQEDNLTSLSYIMNADWWECNSVCLVSSFEPEYKIRYQRSEVKN